METPKKWVGEQRSASATKPAVVKTEEFGEIEIYRLPNNRLAIVLQVPNSGHDPIVIRRAAGDITFYRHAAGKVGFAFPHGVKVQMANRKLDKIPPPSTNTT